MYKNKLDGYIHKGSMEVYLENYQSEKYNMIYDDKMEIRLVSCFEMALYICPTFTFIIHTVFVMCDIFPSVFSFLYVFSVIELYSVGNNIVQYSFT